MKRSITILRLFVLIGIAFGLGCVQDQGSSVPVPANEEKSSVEAPRGDERGTGPPEGNDNSDQILSELKEISKTLKSIDSKLSDKPLPVTIKDPENLIENLKRGLRSVLEQRLKNNENSIKRLEEMQAKGKPDGTFYQGLSEQIETLRNSRKGWTVRINKLDLITNKNQIREFVINYGLQKDYEKILALYR